MNLLKATESPRGPQLSGRWLAASFAQLLTVCTRLKSQPCVQAPPIRLLADAQVLQGASEEAGPQRLQPLEGQLRE